MSKRKRVGLSIIIKILLVLTMAFLCSCETSTTISIEKEKPLTFELSGSGNIYFFGVSEVICKNQPTKSYRYKEESIDLWKIKPIASDSISSLPKITYGQLPEGFLQEIPEKGNVVQISENKLYVAYAPSYNAGYNATYFVIKNGKISIIGSIDDYFK